MISNSISSAPRYRAAIIGLGAIAHGYGSPDDAAPYCHAGGLLHCDRFDFAAAADRFPPHARGFSKSGARLSLKPLSLKTSKPCSPANASMW
jgi:hypothetical protein